MRSPKHRGWLLLGVLAPCLALHAQTTPPPAPPSPPPPPASVPATPHSAAAPVATPTGRAPELLTPDVTELLAKATEALQLNRLSDAQQALNAAKAVNPTQFGLWSLYGDLHSRSGDPATAVADYRKELELHPDSLPVYRSLALAELASNQHQEAAATLRKWQAADPDNPQPAAMQVSILTEDGNPAEAVKVGEEGMTRLPEYARSDPELLFWLGSAEIKAGHRDKGAPMLIQALRTDDLPLKNSVAYALADANLNLPLADAAARDVIERMGLVSEGWTGYENLISLRIGTNALAAAWDTMGWILFREGKLPEAETYLRAAWRNSPHATIGEHLGDLQAARGNHRAALEAYELALASIPKPDPKVQTPRPPEELAELQKRIAAEQKAGTRSTLGDPQAALLRFLTLKLGPAAGHNGKAAYRVLMGRGKVVRALEVAKGGKTLPGGAAVIAHADVAAFFPTPGYTQVVQLGILDCSGTTCVLILQP